MNEFLSIFSEIESFSETVLVMAIYSTMAAAILVVFVLAINILTRKWLTAGQMGLLWGLVLIRLAMPIGPESSFSLQYLYTSSTLNAAPAEEHPEQWEPVDYNSGNTVLQALSQTVSSKPPSTPEISFRESLLHSLMNIIDSLLPFLPFTWFTGAVLILGRLLFTHWRFVRKVNRIPTSTDQRLLQLWKNCCQQVHVRRHIPIIAFDEISQPSVMGAIRPKLLLPTDITDLNDDQLRLIMLHELAHITRRDLGVNWALFVLRLFHWWNPLYWLAVTRFHNLREQSRDAMVLRWREQQDENSTQNVYSREYSELLLTLAQRPDTGSRWRVTLPVSLLGFLTSPLRKRSLANRLKALHGATSKIHPLQNTTIMAVIFLIAASGLTDARTTEMPVPETPLWTTGTNFKFNTVTSDSGPVTMQVYDLSKSIKRIMEEDQISEDQAHQWMLLLVQNQFGFLKSSHRYHGGPLTEDSKPGAEYGEGHQLIVRAPAAWQKEIGFMLNAWELSGMGQVTFETRTAAFSRDIAELAGFEWNRLEVFAPANQISFDELPDSEETVLQASAVVDEYFPIRVAVLNKEQEFQFIQTAQGDARSSMMFAPKMTLFNGQRVSVSNLISRPYVTGLQQQADGQLQSVVDMIEEGLSLTLRPVYSANQSTIHLSGLVQLSQILDVNLYVSKVHGREAAVQVPRVFRRRISVASNLKDEQCLLICIPPSPHQKQFQYLMLKVRFIDKPGNQPDPKSTNTPVKSTE